MPKPKRLSPSAKAKAAQRKMQALQFPIAARNTKGRKVEQKAGQGTRGKSDRRMTIEARMRVHGLSKEQAEMDEAGTVLGRMLLAKHITRSEMAAGTTYAEIVDRFARSRGIGASTCKAPSLMGGGKGEAPDIDLVVYQAAGKAYDAAFVALGEAGRAALMAVNDVAVRDELAPIQATKAGLAALVRHFGVV